MATAPAIHRNSMSKVGISFHRTPNIGDDMQAYACLAHLDCVDTMLDRDQLASTAHFEPTSFITNSWFLLGDDLRVPPPELQPVWHGFRPDARLASSPEWIACLRDMPDPIGCRDLCTPRRLRDAGVPAYFSGCVTLFMGQYLPALRTERKHVVFLDVPVQAERFIPPEVARDAVRLSTFAPAGDGSMLDRMATLLPK